MQPGPNREGWSIKYASQAWGNEWVQPIEYAMRLYFLGAPLSQILDFLRSIKSRSADLGAAIPTEDRKIDAIA